MSRYKMSVAMVFVAGAACSISMAQQRDVPGGRSPVARPRPGQLVPVGPVIYVDPIAVYVDGHQVPFTLGSITDANTVTYDNVTGTTGNFAVPIPPANTTFPQQGLDDINLTTTGAQRLTGIRPAFATQATVANPTCNMAITCTWYNNLNPAAIPPAPVNTTPNVSVTVVFAPGTGWQANATYTSTSFIFFPDGAILSSSGALDVRFFTTTTCTGTAVSTTPNTDFTVAYSQGGTVGTSTDNAWLDGANGGTVDNVYTSTEQVTLAPGTSQRVAFATASVSTTPTGRCCLAGGSCILVTSAQCTGLGGTYGGDATVCAGPCPTAPVLWNNGPLATGATSLSATAAPAGTQWSEVALDNFCTLNVAGFGGLGALRLADDFTVPAGATWNLTSVTLFGYVTNGTTTTSPWTGATLRIVRDDPATGTTVFGDTTTNLLTNTATQASFASLYRIFNSYGAPANAVANRPVWQFELPAVVTLQSGHYYVDFNYAGAGFVPPVSPLQVTGPNTGFGVAAIEDANGRQFISPRWLYTGSNGAAAPGSGSVGCSSATNEIPFIVRGTATGGTCYPNCDGSTQAPILNVADFSCFLAKYASQDPYANCDGSTSFPTLNVADFSCFLSKYAAGCS